MASVTGGAPKELLDVGGFSVLQRVVAEALEAQAAPVRVVGSMRKPQIQEEALGLDDPRVGYAEQSEPLGIADAVRAGVEAGQPALVLLGDTIFAQGSPLPELMGRLSAGAWAAVAVREVELDEISHYGVVGFAPDGLINAIVEKPAPIEAPSRFAIASRFALSADAIGALFATTGQRTVDGLTLSEFLEEGIHSGCKVEAVFLSDEAQLFDCGQPDGYRAAVEAFKG